MAEANVTVDGEIHTLPNPFFVMATQNPIEHEGTYPLPEAQLDRFLVKVKMGYPDFQQEMKLLTRFERDEPIETLEAVIGREQLLQMKEDVKNVHVSQPVKNISSISSKRHGRMDHSTSVRVLVLRSP